MFRYEKNRFGYLLIVFGYLKTNSTDLEVAKNANSTSACISEKVNESSPSSWPSDGPDLTHDTS